MAGIGDLIGGIGGGVLTFGLILVVLLILVAISVAAIIFYGSWKKYQTHIIVIWERDAFGNTRQTYDTAGIFTDKKTNNKRLYLKNSKVGLAADNIPFMVVGKKKMVYVVKRGLKNFQYIKPIINDNDFTFSCTEEDVNWGINAYERQKKIFQNNTLMAYMPFILLAFVSIIILIMFIYFFKDFGVLKDVAIALRDAATAFAQGQSGVITA